MLKKSHSKITIYQQNSPHFNSSNKSQIQKKFDFIHLIHVHLKIEILKAIRKIHKHS